MQAYDRIGVGYAVRRVADPRLAHRIGEALGEARTVVNVGAGPGSYEPLDKLVVAVEPSTAMIRQRAASCGPAVRGYADALPFADGAFEAALAVLTIHHWSNWPGGVREMARVSQHRIVIFTWDPASEGFWLRDYFPELIEKDRERFPAPREIGRVLGNLETHAVPIPHDCTDGFLGAYWRRPAAFLDPRIRAAISSLASVTATAGLNHLAADLADGTWMRKYHEVLERETLDLGYRLCVFAAPA